jgi:nicotinamide-nucleotide amidase
MKAEIISIGTELTTGQNLDTNSQWLSLRLSEMGIPVHFHTTLADDLEENVQAFQVARQRAALVLCTGGLGPTLDDLTRDALAKLAGVELQFHEPSLNHIEEMFSRRGRTMPEANRVQAYCPAGGEMLSNRVGTAPGIWMIIGSTLFVAMPGVPSEMKVMFEEQVRARLQQWAGATGVMVQRKINTFGLGESAIEEKLRDLTRRGHVPEVGITASDATISLRIFARAADRIAAEQTIAPIEKIIRDRLGDLVYGVDDEELQHVVVRLLRDSIKTLSVAEGVTGGLLAQRLTSVPGISQFFRGGVVAYDNRAKIDWLGVPSRLIDEHGAVSPQVAEAMAIGCRVRFGADLALSTVGIAGPGGGSESKPIGLVYAALAWDGGAKSISSNWIAARYEVQNRTAKMALNLARLHLLKDARR